MGGVTLDMIVHRETPSVLPLSVLIELEAGVEGRHVTVKLLLLIYGSLDGQALKFGKPISSSTRCQAFYS